MIASISARHDRPGPPRHFSAECGRRNAEEGISPSFHVPRSALRTSPFTLVEILVVLAITAILLLIGMPAFEKIAKGQGAELAAREMVGKLKAVRAYAVTNRKYVALVMPKENLPEDYLHNAYRACVVNDTGAFQYWIPNENWQRLPTGVAFLDISTHAAPKPVGDADHFNGAMPMITNADFSDMSGTSPDIRSMHAIVFKPNARIKSGAKTYIHLGEGKYSGGSLIITNPNPDAYVTMNIDQYSGRVSYGKE